MDPEATLQALERAIQSAQFGVAVEALNNYYRWRVGGGFMPSKGDERADGLSNLLCDAMADAAGAQATYAHQNAKAKALYDAEFAHLPPGQRPAWESQPLEYRVEWLNKATKRG